MLGLYLCTWPQIQHSSLNQVSGGGSNIWPLNFPDCNPLDYYVCGMVKQETNKTLCNTKDELKARLIAESTIWNKKAVGKASKRFWSCLEATWLKPKRFLWINLIYSISRYFHVILVNIYDKMGCQSYFHFCII